MWKFKRAKNTRYGEEDFLRVFFFEIIGRTIYETSEKLNAYYLNYLHGTSLLRKELFAIMITEKSKGKGNNYILQSRKNYGEWRDKP